jgi:uncharacterized protein
MAQLPREVERAKEAALSGVRALCAIDQGTRAKGVRRIVYLALGFGFLLLALIGAITPLLPATPFLLASSYFFTRTWPALNDRLLRSRLFGPLLKDWQQHRAVRLHVKLTAISMILLSAGLSLFVFGANWSLLQQGGILAGSTVALAIVLRLPVIRLPAECKPALRVTPGDDIDNAA